MPVWHEPCARFRCGWAEAAFSLVAPTRRMRALVGTCPPKTARRLKLVVNVRRFLSLVRPRAAGASSLAGFFVYCLAGCNRHPICPLRNGRPAGMRNQAMTSEDRAQELRKLKQE